jgi:hypothetical protein
MNSSSFVYNSEPTKKYYSTIMSVIDSKTKTQIARLEESLSNYKLVITEIPIDFNPIEAIVDKYGCSITKIVLPPMILKKGSKCSHYLTTEYCEFLNELFEKTPNCHTIFLSDQNAHDYQNFRMYIIDGNYKSPNYLAKLNCLPLNFSRFVFSGKCDKKLIKFIRNKNISEFEFKNIDSSIPIEQIKDTLLKLNLSRLKIVSHNESW